MSWKAKTLAATATRLYRFWLKPARSALLGRARAREPTGKYLYGYTDALYTVPTPMGALGRCLFFALERLRGSRAPQVLEEIRATPFLPRSEILAQEFRQLSALLADVETHVPYYRELFRECRISSRDIRSLQDFACLPVLTKDIIRERHSDLLRENLFTDKLLEFRSGGSTGVPLSFYRDRKFLHKSEVAEMRNLSQCGWRPGEMIAYFWGWSDRLAAISWLEFEIRQYLRHRYQFNPFNSGTSEMDVWLAKWNRLRPTAIIGYASTVSSFTEHVETRG